MILQCDKTNVKIRSAGFPSQRLESLVTRNTNQLRVVVDGFYFVNRDCMHAYSDY